MEQTWIANAQPYIEEMSKLIAVTREAASAVEDLQHTIDALHGKTVDLGVDTAAASAAAAVNDLASAENDLAAAMWKPNAAGQFQIETSRLLAETDAILAGQEERLTAAMSGHASGSEALDAANRLLWGSNVALMGAYARLIDDSHNVASESKATAALIAASAGRIGGAAGTAFRPWFLFGANWATALHWIIAGGAELLSVAVPAAIALGAGLLVAAQGAQNVYTHFSALYSATESLHAATGVTLGSVMGLGSALQRAQDAANPGVYEILGSVVNDAKTRFADFASTGLQVVHMFDEFSARITVDLQGALGGQLHNLLAGMTTDLLQIGQVFGNVGHAVLNFAAAMPGLAHVLLAIADGASRVVLAISSMPAGLITAGMAMEEFFRWGGLVLGVMARLAGAGGLLASFGATNFITRFGAALLGLAAQGGSAIAFIGTLVGRLAGIVPAAGAAGTAMVEAGGAIRVGALEMSAGAAAGYAALAAGAVIAIVAISRIKDATDQWVASTDQAVRSASDLQVIGTITSTLAQNQIKFTAAMQHYGAVTATTATQTGEMTARFGEMNGAQQRAAQDVADLTQQQQFLIGTARTVGANIGFLAGQFHVSALGALALANAAGVNLQQGLLKGSQAGQIAVQMINNLREGLGLMQAPAGAVGAEMSAIGVQSALASTKVQQANQAIDQFVASAVSGTSTWAAFRTSLQGASQGALQLSGSGLTAARNWQTFDQAVTSGNAMLDTLRTGMAENVVGFHTYSQSVHDAVAMLLQLGGSNKTAVAEASTLAQMIGGPATTSFKTLSQWAGITGQKAGPELAAAMAKASAAMSNLSAVAKNLSVVVGQQMDAAFASAAMSASHVDRAYQKYANDIANHAPRSALMSDLKQIQTDQNTLSTITQRGTSVLNTWGNTANAAGGRAAAGMDKAGSSGRTMGATINAASANASAALGRAGLAALHMAAQIAAAAAQGRGSVDALQAAINALHGKTITITTIENTISNTTILQHVVSASTAHSGFQHGGVLPGYQPGVDSIHAMLSPGEGILNPYAVRMLGAGWVHAVNRIAESGGSVNPSALRAGVSGYGGGGGGAVIHNHIILDGREIATSVRRAEYNWQTRNAGLRSGLSIPGTRIG